MDTTAFFNTTLYTWVLLPFLIFAARIFDVTLGTLRVIFITRGMKYLSAVVGFIEILIWLLAIGQIFKNLNNVACYIAYAGGFASGSFLGIYFAEKLSINKVIVRIIAIKDANNLVEQLRKRHFGVTTLDAHGIEGPVTIVFSIINRDDLEEVAGIVKKFNPQAFYSVQDVKFASEGIFPEHRSVFNGNMLMTFRPHRKSK
jgi:uncharacterized protein YebE (UPF0316 family)